MINDKIIAERISLERKCGYWGVNSYYFFNKADCLRYASKIKNFKVTFHYYDSVFQTITWDTEPNESLEQLYKKRAEQLRQKYDYIALLFSGGADSTNVLDSFLKNNIPLDEVITYYPLKAIEKLKPLFNRNDKKSENMIFEFNEAASPKLREIAQKYPNVKITVIDNTDEAISAIMKNDIHNVSIGGLGTGPHLTGLRLVAERMRNYHEKDKATLVTGIDKPRMAYYPKTKQFFTWFHDISGHNGLHTREALGGYLPSFEAFYYTPDMPELWKKACLIMKRKMEPIVESRPPFYNDILFNHPDARGLEIFDVHHLFFKQLLYKDWSENIFQVRKPKSYFFHEINSWCLDTSLTDKKFKDFHYGQTLEFISGVDPKFILYDSKGKPLKFHDSRTKMITIDCIIPSEGTEVSLGLYSKNSHFSKEG